MVADPIFDGAAARPHVIFGDIIRVHVLYVLAENGFDLADACCEVGVAVARHHLRQVADDLLIQPSDVGWFVVLQPVVLRQGQYLWLEQTDEHINALVVAR